MVSATSEGRPRLRRRKLWIALSAIVLLTVAIGGWRALRHKPAVPPAVPEQVAEPEIAAAIGEAREKVLAEPESGQAWGKLGMVFLAHKFNPQADTCLAEAEARNPEDPRWPYYRSLAVREFDPAVSRSHLRSAAKKASLDTVSGRAVHLALAEAELGEHALDEAEVIFRRVLEAEPEEPRAAFGIGVIVLGRGEKEGSLPYFTVAARSPGLRKHSLIQLAMVHRQLDHQEAAARFEREAASLPEGGSWPDPYVEEYKRLDRGPDGILAEIQTLRAEGRVQDAVRLAQNYSETHSTASTRLRMGLALLEIGAMAAAEVQFRKCLSLDPNHASARRYLVMTLVPQADADRKAGRKESARLKDLEAIEQSRRILKKEPTDAGISFFLGLALLNTNAPAEAAAAFRAAIAGKPGQAEIHYYLAESLLQTGNKPEAVEAARIAEQLSGDQVPDRLKDLKRRLEKSPPPKQ